jgi:hypothetical protein
MPISWAASASQKSRSSALDDRLANGSTANEPSTRSAPFGDARRDSCAHAFVGVIARQLLAHAPCLDAHDRVVPRIVVGDVATEHLDADDDFLELQLTTAERRADDVREEVPVPLRATKGLAGEDATERVLDQRRRMARERQIGRGGDPGTAAHGCFDDGDGVKTGRAVHDSGRADDTQWRRSRRGPASRIVVGNGRREQRVRAPGRRHCPNGPNVATIRARSLA